VEFEGGHCFCGCIPIFYWWWLLPDAVGKVGTFEEFSVSLGANYTQLLESTDVRKLV
jgi:hypothetical protein